MLRTYLEHLFAINHNTIFRFDERETLVKVAEQSVIKDYQYHYATPPVNSLQSLLVINEAWLAVFLYRLGRACYLANEQDALIPEIHRLIRVQCSMEIYFSIPIGEGFEVRHGIGTVIGSRCSIGKGFVVHQGCTVGHRVKFGNGPTILDDVEMGVNSSILGDITIGNKVIVGAHALVLHDVSDAQKIIGGH
jgi:serine O-acetyltransferase